MGWRHHWEIRPATRYVLGGNIGEEGTLPVATHGGGRVHRICKPVRVEVVTLSPAVLDELQGLEMCPRRVKALE